MAGSAFVVIIDRAPRENITLTQRAGIRESGRRRNARATHRSSYMRVHGRISLNGPCCQNKHTPRTPSPLGIQMQARKCIFSLGTKRHSPCLRRCENYARVPECGAFCVSRARILNFRRLSHGNLFYAAPKTDCAGSFPGGSRRCHGNMRDDPKNANLLLLFLRVCRRFFCVLGVMKKTVE